MVHSMADGPVTPKCNVTLSMMFRSEAAFAAGSVREIADFLRVADEENQAVLIFAARARGVVDPGFIIRVLLLSW
jgi:hypothetical protein